VTLNDEADLETFSVGSEVLDGHGVATAQARGVLGDIFGEDDFKCAALQWTTQFLFVGGDEAWVVLARVVGRDDLGDVDVRDVNLERVGELAAKFVVQESGVRGGGCV